MKLIPNRLYYMTHNRYENYMYSYVFLFEKMHNGEYFGKPYQLKPEPYQFSCSHTFEPDLYLFELLPESFTIQDFIDNKPFRS